MIEYLIKICRTLSMDFSHGIMVGLSKCGKKIVVKLAAYLISCEFHTIKDNVEMKEWNECLKIATKNTYKNKAPSILMIEHRQLITDQHFSDINTLLNTMYLPSIYSEADIEEMIFMTQIELVRKNLPIDKNHMLQEFLPMLQKKLHLIILMNHSFDSFSSNMSKYPAFKKYCNFFFMNPWPKEALSLVANLEMSDLGYPLDFLPLIH